MADYYDVEESGNGRYTVTPRDNPGCFSVVAVFILILFLGFVVTRCDSGSSNVASSKTESAKPIPTIQAGDHQTEKQSGVQPSYLAYLHLIDETYSACEEKEISDSFGATYGRPYISLFSTVTFTDTIDGYAEFATDRNYEYFSGTYFTTAEASDAQLWFKIYADGELIYKSEPISKRTEPVYFCVNIGGAQRVRIEATTDYYSEYIYLVNAIVYN